MRLIDELNQLHAYYLTEIDVAVGRDDFAEAHRLAQAYEDDAIRLMAVRENKTDLLPLRPAASPEGSLRRLVSRLTTGRAA